MKGPCSGKHNSKINSYNNYMHESFWAVYWQIYGGRERDSENGGDGKFRQSFGVWKMTTFMGSRYRISNRFKAMLNQMLNRWFNIRVIRVESEPQSMAKSLPVEIPQDIIDSVIAAAGEDTRLLKQCALVSSSFFLPSRKQLFSRITLRNDKTCQRIHQIFAQNPILQSSVRAITLDDGNYGGGKDVDLATSTALPAFLWLPFCCLECFSIDYPCHWDWNRLSSELKDALSNIIHLSNLKTLSLLGITEVPTAFFLHIFHLTTLELRRPSPIDSGYEISSSPTRSSNGVASKTSQVVVDRLLWSMTSVDERTIFLFISLFLTNSGT